MTRHKPVIIEVSQQGKFFALQVEEQAIAIITDRKAADTLQLLLKGLVFYGSRQTFRTVLKDALNPKPKVEKPKKGAKSEATTETPAPATEPPAPPVNGAKPKSKKPQVNKNRLEHQLKDKRAQLARNGVKVEVAA